MNVFKAQSNLQTPAESLNVWQFEEFTPVELHFSKIIQQLQAKRFDPAIQLQLKLKPKFTLRQLKRSRTGLTQFTPIYSSSCPKSNSAKSDRTVYTASVAVIMPVYNRALYLGAAIESVLAQTYTDYKLIIWDDGSTDNSLSIAKKYARIDSRIKVFSRENRGQASAMSDAIALGHSKYVAQLDSDDLLHPEALNLAVTVLDKDANIGMVYSDHLMIDAEGNVRGLGNRSRIPYSPQRLLIDFMTFHFRLIRREVYDAVGGYDINLGTAEDYDLCLKLSEVTQIEHIEEPLYYYRWHDDNISTKQHLKQIKCSAIAVNRALVRRGLSSRIALEVKLNPQYILRRDRPVANKVFGIGLSKTGTTSLNAALNLLGIPSIHLPHFLNQIKDFDGATDIPIAMAYQKLDQLYPGSKFILTIRHLRNWLRSCQLHQQRLEQIFEGQIPDWLKELTIQCYGQWEFESAVWSNVYRRHLQSVVEYFQHKRSQLLILDICGGQGWQELCSFLNCKAPNIAFPARNKTPAEISRVGKLNLPDESFEDPNNCSIFTPIDRDAEI